jgi:hypothetical protein
MKFIAIFLFGMLCGVILWEYIGVNTVFRGNFKIKQRGKGNTQMTDLDTNLTPQTKRERKIISRLKRRQDKSMKKLERKRNK